MPQVSFARSSAALRGDVDDVMSDAAPDLPLASLFTSYSPGSSKPFALLKKEKETKRKNLVRGCQIP